MAKYDPIKDKIRRDKNKAEALLTGLLYGRPIKEVIFDRYKKNAIKRELAFELTLEEFSELWNLPCSYCGSPIQTIGVDRIDNELGYVKGNITPCCTTCNLSKRGMLAEDYISHCVKVAKKSRGRF